MEQVDLDWECPLQMLMLKSVPELSEDMMATISKKFPQLEVLILEAGKVGGTIPITDLVLARPGMVILVNKRLYFHTSLTASEWSLLVRRNGLRDKLSRVAIKNCFVVTPHTSGSPFLNRFSISEPFN